jgi:hypothetical protein
MRNDKATAAAEETAGTHLLDVDHGIMNSNKDNGEPVWGQISNWLWGQIILHTILSN